ncbi:MAG: lmo0937 family membrane protein [Chloroflexota bacterium]|nr:MAG: lmo0937 family membrane protein [Chloroflexota bacterium]
MLWFLVVLLVVLWLLGLVANIGGNLIYILLVLAAVALIFNLLFGRRYV